MPHQPLKRPRSPNALSARSLVILFLATLSVSFMLLLILFQVVFKNIHLQFNTRTPETAPTLSKQSGGFFQSEAPMFQRMGVQSANIQTPSRTSRSVVAPSLAETPTATAATTNDIHPESYPANNPDAAPPAPLPTLPSVTTAPPLPSARPSVSKGLPPKATTATKPAAKPIELE